MTAADGDLARLAALHGVATRYENWRDEPVTVPVGTIRAVLAAMGVPAGTPGEVREAVRAAKEAPWRRLVDPTVVVTAGAPGAMTVTAPAGTDPAVWIVTVGAEQPGPPLPDARPPKPRASRIVDGERYERQTVRLPPDLPVGAHRVEVFTDDRRESAHLLVVPPRCPVPGGLRAWGWQVQLYALRSRASWGIGDLGDLRTLATTSGLEGADLVLLNPLHAVLPVLPQEPSPYYPASRRFANPLYLRVEDCDGYDALGPEERARVDALAGEARADNRLDRIDRDAAFRRKMAAFALLAAQPLPPDRQAAYAAYRDAEGAGLIDFATAAALAERHGRSFRDWPQSLRDPRSAAVTEARAELAERVALHLWLQWQCDEQLASAARAAREAGMAVGLVADLAVGVDPGGADAWALQADLAQDVTVGAPPDAFNQQGQDWRLPPLRPDRLPATGYAPFRDLVRSQLRHAGGLRIDHVLGLFRLFWIPEGAGATDGTYVRYPGEALLGVLALEAQASGALVVGEDLGTVERGVRDRLRSHAVLGSRVLWFEREEREEAGGGAEPPRLAAGGYPELALTSVTTHDLPTAAGYLADEATRVRAVLGQLGGDVAAERARAAQERAELLDLLVAEGVLAEEERDDRATAALALHAFVARTPSLLVTASLADGVGDLRQPNLPGTTDEYPNWRLPVARPTGRPGTELLPPSRPLLLEELLADPGVRDLATVLREGRAERAASAEGTKVS